QTNYTSTFRYENGTKGAESNIVLRSFRLNETHSNITITSEETVESFLANPNGTVYQNGELKGNYSIWWVYVPNVMMMFGANPGDTFNVIDPTGFLGIIDRSYELIVEEKITYWPVDPELSGLLGAQSSFTAKLWDKTNETLISTITFDMTCGHIEILEGSQLNNIKLTLISTDFPVSRNRIFALIALVILGAIIIVSSFILMSFEWKQKLLAKFTQEKKDRNEIILLIIPGVIAMGLELMDIWFYLPFGMYGSLGIHLLYTIFLLIICLKQKYGYYWIIPSVLEVAFVFSLNAVTGDPFVPPLTAFMGSLCSWLMMVYASGIEKYQK
ncbi:MAG: hypothetical protein GY870_02960, partial [archaeon]|nr:hypothetical protein [archaeon]